MAVVMMIQLSALLFAGSASARGLLQSTATASATAFAQAVGSGNAQAAATAIANAQVRPRHLMTSTHCQPHLVYSTDLQHYEATELMISPMEQRSRKGTRAATC